MTKKILLTGGGTAGHVTPNIALIPALKQKGFGIHYAGGYNSVEETLIKKNNIAFHRIHTGKLRRYFSWQNFIDPFKVLAGIWQSFWLCKRINPDIVFSKGGFVALPVTLGAWLNQIPVILHESDVTPGLANKIGAPLAKKIALTFTETQKYFKDKTKCIVTGTPVRNALFHGSKENGLAITNFDGKRPVILVICGSSGSITINKMIRESLTKLTQHYDVIHVCGKNKIDTTLNHVKHYHQFEYVNDELPDLFAAADLVISRSGANTLYELLSLHKLNILIPLSTAASRGDQIINARIATQQGYSHTIKEEQLTTETLLNEIKYVFDNAKNYHAKLNTFESLNSIEKIISLIEANKKY